MTEATPGDDQAQRTRALDIARSFIVQAPAGSGKTGLLIQRYLALLAQVERPEAIVAMTFTRKAAGEIRERIVAALRLAESEAVPDNAHDARTHRLARAARERDAAMGWQLITHPARLQVHTIDALCAALMRQAPLTAKLGAMPRFVERAQALYVEAARAALAAADASDASWKSLLEHLDNDADRLVALIAELLARREQWLRHLAGDDPRALRAHWERALVAEIESELAIARAAVPAQRVGSLLELARYASGNLATDAGDHALALCAACAELPPAAVTALEPWRTLCDWLLTREGEFRRKLDKGQGFPAKGNASENGHAERDARKQEMLALLGDLAAVPGLAAALDVVRRLPPPAYDDAAWSFIAALFEVLPKVVARLQLVFAEAGSIDFAEAMLVALRALDSAERPSDLLLALDMRIGHLMVDEFQDTSIAQCELIERLTEGWQHGDGRTLFLVGDPMQSIYRFREAEVGLFLAARQRAALGGIALEPLTLARNFRSQRCLVDWVNRVFPAVLRPVDDPARGAVAFKAAVAARDPLSEAAVTLDLCADAQDEARVAVERIEAALRAESGSIAVLVRKRADLEALLPALRSAGIAFAAVDLDRLSERQAILDLTSLTHAMTQPDDRLAWLASLRAPWCGLTLPDLFAAARAAGARLWEALGAHASGNAIPGLSSDGNARLARFIAVVAPALKARGRVPLMTMVRGAWLGLGGPATVAEPIDLAAAERFFALLAEHASGAEVRDWAAFTDALDTLYAQSASATTTRVFVMTLHRAKGLEFDTVLLPGLARRPKRPEPTLLRWRQRRQGVLLAPIKARATRQGDDDPVYAYLGALEADEEEAELARLLYVGCTRARQRLHLSAVLGVERGANQPPRWKTPVSGTALASLWAALAPDVESPLDRDEPPRLPPTSGAALLRLPLDWRVPEPPAALQVAVRAEAPPVREAIEFDWARETAKHIGTVAHRMLRHIALEGLERWSEERLAGERRRVEIELRSLGIAGLEAARAADDVLASIATTLADPRGRWLFDTSHSDAASECALTAVRDDAMVNIVLDRTFVDAEGTRWIIDFKLSRHAGGDVVTFLDNERERYREQLERYATVMRAIDSRPIRLGLYFPLLGGWREWDAPI